MLRTNVRVIAATNRDLRTRSKPGCFASDLYYRLNVFPIEMPALRERTEDIPILVEYLIARYASKTGKKIRGIGRTTLDRLKAYPWPGNIRELQNLIERSIIVCETENFTVDESWLSRKPTRPKRPCNSSSGRRPRKRRRSRPHWQRPVDASQVRGCGGQAWYPCIDAGLKNKGAPDQQASLQECLAIPRSG